MGQHFFDVDDLFLKPDAGDQPVLVSANVEHRQIADLVYGVERRLEFSPVAEAVLLNHPAPTLQGLIGLRIRFHKIP